jgi:hypothetical protein
MSDRMYRMRLFKGQRPDIGIASCKRSAARGYAVLLFKGRRPDIGVAPCKRSVARGYAVLLPQPPSFPNHFMVREGGGRRWIPSFPVLRCACTGLPIFDASGVSLRQGRSKAPALPDAGRCPMWITPCKPKAQLGVSHPRLSELRSRSTRFGVVEKSERPHPRSALRWIGVIHIGRLPASGLEPMPSRGCRDARPCVLRRIATLPPVVRHRGDAWLCVFTGGASMTHIASARHRRTPSAFPLHSPRILPGGRRYRMGRTPSVFHIHRIGLRKGGGTPPAFALSVAAFIPRKNPGAMEMERRWRSSASR